MVIFSLSFFALECSYLVDSLILFQHSSSRHTLNCLIQEQE